jgi:hypothetical protein
MATIVRGELDSCWVLNESTPSAYERMSGDDGASLHFVLIPPSSVCHNSSTARNWVW